MVLAHLHEMDILKLHSQVVEHEQDPFDDCMPVDKPSTFEGKMSLSQFSFSPGATSNRTTGLSSPSSPSKVRIKVSGNPWPNGLTTERTQRYRTPGTPTPTTRSQSRAKASTSNMSTTATMTSASPLRQTRPQTVSSSPSTRNRNKIPSSKSRRRHRGASVGTTEESPVQSTEEESLLRDSLADNLILLMVGVNPGRLTGKTGFAYAHHTNQFWKLLHASGITEALHEPSFTYDLPEQYEVGNTNIVERATRVASDLSKQEMDMGVLALEGKIKVHKPKAVCLVGKGIWEAVLRVKMGQPIRKEKFEYGWQDLKLGKLGDYKGADVFVATTTSGVSTTFSFDEKVEIWRPLGEWTRRMREERKQNALSASSSE